MDCITIHNVKDMETRCDHQQINKEHVNVTMKYEVKKKINLPSLFLNQN